MIFLLSPISHLFPSISTNTSYLIKVVYLQPFQDSRIILGAMFLGEIDFVKIWVQIHGEFVAYGYMLGLFPWLNL